MIRIELDPPYNTDELNAIAVMIAALGGRAGVTVDTLHGEHRGVSDRWDDAIAMEAEQPNYSAADNEAITDVTVVTRGSGYDPTLPLPGFPFPSSPSTLAPVSAAVPLPPATAPSPSAGVETDSEGLPWDARIHAETKRKTKDERWARRRNTTDELWNSVRAQLQQTMAATGAPSGTGASIPPVIEAQALGQPLSPEVDAAAAFTTATLVPPVPIPAPPVVVPPPPAALSSGPGEDEFTRILTKTVAMQTAGTITPEQVNAICAQLGLPEGVRSLMSRPDLLPQFEMMLGG